ncbi:MAG: glycosyltransferase family 2 protein [Spirochaetia bacterium]|jgi:glycosyltransferase involved in cell wall biosynthesis|nr:glycosyltransferase family 2 protein [Spirochaetia bacterium]
MKLSICIPVYNGEKTIGSLVETVIKTLDTLDIEIVLVNDGSRDSSEDVCIELARNYNLVKFVALRRNYGQHNAVMCALNYCTGDFAVLIDDDSQNPPSEILKLLEEIQNGYDVVYAAYHNKKHHWFRNLGSKVNDIFATWLLNKPADLYLCSFKIINRELIDEIIKYKGPFPYIDGLILRCTSNISSVYVEHLERKDGESNYTLGKLLSLWLNMFINFSIKPMRVITIIGLLTAVFSLIAGLAFIIEKIRNPNLITGWASLAVLILFFGGVHSIFLGILGEYIAKNYLDRNGTPQWVEKKVYGMKKKNRNLEKI